MPKPFGVEMFPTAALWSFNICTEAPINLLLLHLQARFTL